MACSGSVKSWSTTSQLGENISPSADVILDASRMSHCLSETFAVASAALAILAAFSQNRGLHLFRPFRSLRRIGGLAGVDKRPALADRQLPAPGRSGLSHMHFLSN